MPNIGNIVTEHARKYPGTSFTRVAQYFGARKVDVQRLASFIAETDGTLERRADGWYHITK